MVQDSPRHYYMATILATYVREDKTEGGSPINPGPRSRYLNLVLELNRKQVTAKDLRHAELGAQQRIADELGESFKELREVVFIGFSYLGHMKPAEFYQKSAAPTKTQH